MKDKKRDKKMQSKVIHGLTAEERFKEIYGITSEEWRAKQEKKFEAKTGMTYDEWYINKVKSLTPIDTLKDRFGDVSEDDITLVKDLQSLGLNDDVINVLLDYVAIISTVGLVHPLVRKMGESWFKKNISTIEKAIFFVREQQKKHKESSEE